MNELERGREAEEEIREALMIQPPDDVRLIFISFTPSFLIRVT